MKTASHKRKALFATSRTQIICTIGPASRSPEKIRALINAGMNIARLHCSYSDPAERIEDIHRLRRVSRQMRRDIKILLDLSGAKIRLGSFARKSVELHPGDFFTLTSRPLKGDASIVSVNIPELIPSVKRGDTVLLADGELRLLAVSKTRTDLRCRVIVGGHLKAGQAVHVPSSNIPVKVPTAKDLADVKLGIENGVDWIAQSYATSARELERLRAFIRQCGAHTPIVAKIERRNALRHLDELLAVTDLVMVARGDLGLEIPLEEIGLAQKKIIASACRARKPVITATEMLFSMMEKSRPLRAEVTDITNAILDGSSAVMLSGESAVGKFPVEATRVCARIAAAVDKARSQHSIKRNSNF